MKITKDQVRHVAELARLDIEDRDLDRFCRDLGEILEYAESLGRVDTTKIPPTSHAVEISNAFRQDIVAKHLDREEALKNAPESEEGSFAVPRVIE
ncbi:MAG: Asp-tRNA(Asn)/Glu-tRNA(Gln) amidotransferase subunit GatC [Desulfobacterales bacterium]